MLGRLKQYVPSGIKHLMLSVYNRLGGVKIVDNGKNNQVTVGNDCNLLGAKIIFRGNNNTVIIGNNCRLQKSILYLIDDGNKLTVGDNNDWGKNVTVISEEGTNISIGSDCQVAVNVAIRSSDGHSIISNETNKRINPALDITIGDRCWFGEHVKVLKGADIKSDCIIGASSIVTRGVYESNSVYAGNPIRRVKTDVHWIVPRI